MPHVVPGDVVQLLHQAIEALGERRVLDSLGVSRLSLARALAGLPVRRGTHALVLSGLSALQSEFERTGSSSSEATHEPPKDGR